MHNKKALFMMAVYLAGCITPAAPPEAKLTFTSIITAFEKHMQADRTFDKVDASISVAIIHKDTIVWSRAFGYADKDTHLPADTSTIYRIGSVSKSFTSFLMMELVEKGVLKLNDPVELYLPEVKKLKGYNDSTKITFLQLASHSSGLEREPELIGADAGPIANWEKILLEAIPATSFESKPGTKFSYSNIGYAILGLALSRAAGKPFITLVEENIFVPLQMKNSFYVVPPEKNAKLAKGMLNNRFGGVNLATPRMEHAGRGYKVPNGGIYSTPNDLSKFIMAQLGYSKLLSDKSLTAIQTNVVPESKGSEAAYGLGLYTFGYDNYRLFRHAGSVAGYSAEMAFEKNSKYGVVLLCNYNVINVNLGWRAQELLKQLSELNN
jgi:CubicO group peptidase (beta-lactamase class C family)